MPKQNNAAEEDYLDNLLNSVLKNDGGEEIPDDIFRDDLKELAGSDDDFFSNIEKGWMKDPSQSESSRLPEKVAKEELKKQEDIENNRAAEKKAGSGELQNAPESEKTQGNQESEEQQGTQESEKTQGNQESEDDMMGLYDILGVTPENAGEDTAGIEDLEKNDRSSKKKKKKRKLFGRKKREDTAEEQKVDLALDLMQNGQKEAEALPEKADEQEKATGSEENTSEEAEENTPQVEGQPEGTPGATPEDETESINSLISDLGLGEGLDDIPEKTDEPEEEQPAEDKKKKKKKKEKKKKPKKQKKPKQKKPKKPKKEKKPKEPKGPEEIIKVPIPFLIFLLSVGALMVLGVLFGGSYYQYQTGISNATTYYVNQKYGQAYDELYHLDIKKDDEYFYGQVNTVMQVYANYRSYAELIKIGNYTDALDSLLNGVRMFDKYKDIARDEYNCYNDLSQALTWIDTALQDVYGITESEAREINLGGKKLAYSKRVAEIAGQAERKDAQTDDSDN